MRNKDASIVKNTFAKGLEGWCSYEYHASVVAGREIFILVNWERKGGPGKSGYIWTNQTGWSADTPETPISILCFLTYRHFVNEGPIDLRNAECSVYLRGDELKLYGAKCLFWVNRSGERWHLNSRPLEISENTWSDKPLCFSLPNDEALWNRSWSPPTPRSLDGTLAFAISYGFSFVGFSSEVRGRLCMSQFEITLKR